MLETFDSAHSRDFRQRYSGSFGYYTVPETRKRILVQMEQVDEVTAGFRDARGAMYSAKADTGVEFEFILLSKRLFIMDKCLYLVRRKPARQWSRGCHNGNTTVMRVHTGRDTKLTFASVAAGFDSTPIDGYASVTALERKEAEAALLSPMFGVEGSVLYLYDHAIGSFMADRKEIVVEERMFKQEVEDLVARLGLNYRVLDKT